MKSVLMPRRYDNFHSHADPRLLRNAVRESVTRSRFLAPISDQYSHSLVESIGGVEGFQARRASARASLQSFGEAVGESVVKEVIVRSDA